MSYSNKQLLLLLTGTILFDYFFWKESPGLNILLMNSYILLTVLILSPSLLRSKAALISTVGSFVTAIIIALHGSLFAIFMHFFSLLVMIGFIHQQSLRSLFFAFPTAVGNYLALPGNVIHRLTRLKNSSVQIRSSVRFFKILILPLILLIIFYFLFASGNLIFADLTGSFMNKLASWITLFFRYFSLMRILFFVCGAFLVSGLIYNYSIGTFAESESSLPEYIERQREAAQIQRPARTLSLGLKNEKRAAIFLLLLINLMLAIVNVIDISSIWIGFQYTPKFDLKHFVHEGTYMLIASILLSMAVMLFYFRKNLNFYPNAGLLKYLSYTWIVQNVVLLISVCIRNYHYIHYFGLAYKRIGVIIFLLLVLFGLVTLFVKIREKKSGFYLFRTNSWGIYAILLCASLVDWDSIIARYNLSHPLKDNMETSFLLSLSDQVLPEIDRYPEILDQSTALNTYRSFGALTYHQVYEERVKNFMKRIENSSWLSRNRADSKAYQYFKTKGTESDRR